MKNDSRFIIRLPKALLDEFNQILEEQAVNRSALIRKWIREYVDKNK